jgi:hypothetical protein
VVLGGPRFWVGAALRRSQLRPSAGHITKLDLHTELVWRLPLTALPLYQIRVRRHVLPWMSAKRSGRSPRLFCCSFLRYSHGARDVDSPTQLVAHLYAGISEKCLGI